MSRQKFLPILIHHLFPGVLSITAALALVVGCVTQSSPVTPAPDPVTLTFTFPQSHDRTRYQTLVDRFQAQYPHITVRLRPDPTGEWTRDPHNAVDAFVWWPDPSLVAGDHPQVWDLTSLLEKTPELSPDTAYTRAVDMCRLEDRYWAIPAEIDMQLLYYNRDTLDARAVYYPQSGWTWDDLLATAQALTFVDPESDTRIQRHYGLVTHPAWGDYVPFVYQNGGDLFAPNASQTTEALRWYTGLTRVYGVVPSISQLVDGDTYGFFGQARAAMWIGFLGDRDGMGFHHLGTPWAFDWGVVPLPGSATEATLYRGQCYYITSHTANVDAAWVWIQYLSSHPTGRGLPAQRPVAQSAEFRSLVGDEVAVAALYAVERLVPRPTNDIASPEILETYARTVESVVNDGERWGIYSSPTYLERSEALVLAVLNGRYTLDEAITLLRGGIGIGE